MKGESKNNQYGYRKVAAQRLQGSPDFQPDEVDMEFPDPEEDPSASAAKDLSFDATWIKNMKKR